MNTIADLNIDGFDFTADYIEAGEFILEVSRDSSTRSVNLALSSPVIVTGEAFNYLFAKFFNDCSGSGTVSAVYIITNCCEIQLGFEMRSPNIVFDEVACEAELTLLTVSKAQDAYDKLRRRPWWDNPLVTGGFHPQIKYMGDPNYFQRLSLAGIFSNPNYNNSRFHSFHIAPLIFPILQFNCQEAGVTFTSDTIFSQYPEYQRIGLTMSVLEEGPRTPQPPDRNTNPNFRPETAPLQTTMELLESFIPVFNADMEITSTELRFERHDWWQGMSTPILDLDTERGLGTIEGFRGYQPDTERNYAYAQLEYSEDSTDAASRRAKWAFSDIIEWNPNNDPSLKGAFRVTVPFSPVHCVGDQPYADYILRDRIIGTSDELNEIWRQFQGEALSEYMMFMTSGQSQFPKMVIVPIGAIGSQHHWPPETTKLRRNETIDGGSDPRYGFLAGGNARVGHVCPQLSFREAVLDGLYQRFYAIEATTNKRDYIIADLTWTPDDFCASVDHLLQNGMRTSVSTRFGPGLSESISINFTQKSLTFQNLRVRRQC